jgi:outer membrane protein OmpA-like peptidoglycan-associated protein
MIKYFFRYIFLFLAVSAFAKAPAEDIRVTVVAVDDTQGEPIKNDVTVTVTNLKTGSNIPLKTVKGKKFYEIKTSGQIKVAVTALGYYPEEKLVDAETLDDQSVIEVRLRPSSGIKLAFKIIDADTKKAIPAKIEIKFFSKNDVIDYDPENDNGYYSLFKDGSYQVRVSADNYFEFSKAYDIKTNQGDSEIQIELKKLKTLIEISIVNKSSNQPVMAGKVSIKHKEKNVKVYDGLFSNGKIKIEAKEGEVFTAVIDAPGFYMLNETFKIGVEKVKFGLVPNSSLRLEVYDETSGERIAGEVLVKSPNGKLSKLMTSKLSDVSFVPNEIGSYSVETNFQGYMNKLGAVSISSLNQGDIYYSIRIKKGSNDYVISVFDNQTKQPIDFAKIRVYTDRNTEVQGRSQKNSKTLRLDPEKKHFFEVVAEGYIDYTQNLNDEKILNVYMSKPKRDTLDSFTLKIIDSHLNIPIEGSKLRVVDNSKNLVSVKYDASNKSFIINKLDTKGIYILEAYAKNYVTVVDTLNMKSLPESISLEPSEKASFSFFAEDAISKKQIEADYVITSNNVKIKTEPFKLGVKAVLAGVHNYDINVSLPDYKTIAKPLNRLESAGNEFRFKLTKSKYPISLKLQSKAENAVANLSLSKQFKTDNLVFTAASQTFEASLEPEKTYFLNITADGFESFSSTLNLKDIDPNTFTYLVNLVPKKVVAEKPAVTSKVEEKAALEKPNTKITEKDGVIVGKKYPLEGVEFERSQAVMTKGHEAKLQPLLDFLLANPKSSVEIVGHTDKDGSDERLNVRLSEFRAKRVGNYLFNKGISTNRIKTAGKGSAEPIETGDSEEKRQKNRRIEVFISEN